MPHAIGRIDASVFRSAAIWAPLRCSAAYGGSFPSRKFWMNFVSSTERFYIGSSPSEYFSSVCRIDGYSASGPAADVRSKRLIAPVTSDDFIRGAGLDSRYV